MAGRGGRGPTQGEINTALLTALTGLTEHVEGLGRGNGGHNVPPPFDLARATTNISRSRLGTYSGKVDPEALDLWFRQMEKQFEINEVPNDRKVTIAAYHLEGEADRWWRMASPDAIQIPGFGWTQFMEILEARFIPAELKHGRMEEFMSFKQGTMTVQDYTDKFNRLAHFATPLLPDEAQKAFFYRNGLDAEVAHSIPRSASTMSDIYNEALWGEKSLERVRKAKACPAHKRPFQPFTPTPPAKRFQPNESSNFDKPNIPQKFEGRKASVCFKCRKSQHPGKTCEGDTVTCFHCFAPGHKSYDCPLKVKPAAAANANAAPRPKGRIFLLSRAEAEANPSILTGMPLL